ncbi:MAG TPA: DUF2252 family protein [Bryobacteraceae bacterium]|nr:DUF2252 family protein [Bryobacteraceae bacterium]
MKIEKATVRYEEWLARELTVVASDLAAKHAAMSATFFPFLRATYYRWAQMWPAVCEDLKSAAEVLAVGDLHVENFGTWRDSEGRLIWGINDFDEAWRLPYTHDLVRLATSAHTALSDSRTALDPRDAASVILEGYTQSLACGGRPFVLAEHHNVLREMAVHRLKDVCGFWDKLQKCRPVKGMIPAGAEKGISRMLPDPTLPRRYVQRVAGLGSLGRQRFVALAEWHAGNIAREAKAMAPSACWWAGGCKGSARINYQEILDTAVRCCDPYVKLKGKWIVRRLAPDCSRIELTELPKGHDERVLLHAMGFETANVHLGSKKSRAILADLKRRPEGWLAQAAEAMVKAVTKDWQEWRKSHPVPKKAAAR